MALEVTVTIKSGPGHGAPWTVIKGTPDEVADLLKVPDYTGKVSQIARQAGEVAAYVAGEFEKLNPGKG